MKIFWHDLPFPCIFLFFSPVFGIFWSLKHWADLLPLGLESLDSYILFGLPRDLLWWTLPLRIHVAQWPARKLSSVQRNSLSFPKCRQPAPSLRFRVGSRDLLERAPAVRENWNPDPISGWGSSDLACNRARAPTPSGSVWPQALAWLPENAGQWKHLLVDVTVRTKSSLLAERCP